MRSSSSVLLFPILMFLLTGGEPDRLSASPIQAAPAAESEPSVGLQPRPAVPVGPDYRVGSGDVLRVSVFEEPQFTTTAVVRPDGKVSIPLISDLPVAGLTPEAAQEVLTERLSRFVKHPRVTVIVQEIHSRIVYVTGEVQHPGAYPLITQMNVIQLIARAGGPTEFAKKKEVYVLHQDGGAKVKVNYQMVLAGKHLEENIGLAPGDTVVVP